MIEYRKLTTKEIDTFIEMRIQLLREEGAVEDIDLKPALYEYYVKYMSDGTFVSWLAIVRYAICLLKVRLFKIKSCVG